MSTWLEKIEIRAVQNNKIYDNGDYSSKGRVKIEGGGSCTIHLGIKVGHDLYVWLEKDNLTADESEKSILYYTFTAEVFKFTNVIGNVNAWILAQRDI